MTKSGNDQLVTQSDHGIAILPERASCWTERDACTSFQPRKGKKTKRSEETDFEITAAQLLIPSFPVKKERQLWKNISFEFLSTLSDSDALHSCACHVGEVTMLIPDYSVAPAAVRDFAYDSSPLKFCNWPRSINCRTAPWYREVEL